MKGLFLTFARGMLGALKTVLKIALGVVVIFGVYAAYGAYREPIARADAHRLCASIKVGDPAEGIVERAIEAGAERTFARWISLSDKYVTTKERHLSAIFVGLPPFSRHICEIDATDVVTSAKYFYMD